MHPVEENSSSKGALSPPQNSSSISKDAELAGNKDSSVDISFNSAPDSNANGTEVVPPNILEHAILPRDTKVTPLFEHFLIVGVSEEVVNKDPLYLYLFILCLFDFDIYNNHRSLKIFVRNFGNKRKFRALSRVVY